MRIGLIIGVSVVTLLAFATTSTAGGGCQQDMQSAASHIFDASDANGDGTLSPEEYTGAELERFGVAFEAFDTNQDGEASREEYLELFQQHHPPAGSLNI